MTAIKVFFVDMAEVKNIWRVVSFAAFGLVLIITSIAYGKLGATQEDSDEDENSNASDIPE